MGMGATGIRPKPRGVILAQRAALQQGSLVAGTYEKTVDRESAYERLQARAEPAATGAPVPAAAGRA